MKGRCQRLISVTTNKTVIMADTTIGLSSSIIKHAKLAFSESKSNDASFDAFLKRLTSPESSAALSVQKDLTHPLSHYFISSSHNTYLCV